MKFTGQDKAMDITDLVFPQPASQQQFPVLRAARKPCSVVQLHLRCPPSIAEAATGTAAEPVSRNLQRIIFPVSDP